MRGLGNHALFARRHEVQPQSGFGQHANMRTPGESEREQVRRSLCESPGERKGVVHEATLQPDSDVRGDTDCCSERDTKRVDEGLVSDVQFDAVNTSVVHSGQHCQLVPTGKETRIKLRSACHRERISHSKDACSHGDTNDESIAT